MCYENDVSLTCYATTDYIDMDGFIHEFRKPLFLILGEWAFRAIKHLTQLFNQPPVKRPTWEFGRGLKSMAEVLNARKGRQTPASLW